MPAPFAFARPRAEIHLTAIDAGAALCAGTSLVGAMSAHACLPGTVPVLRAHARAAGRCGGLLWYCSALI